MVDQRQSIIQISTGGVSLYGPNGIIGKTLAFTASEDDLGNGGNETSLENGNSGMAVACGIIDPSPAIKTAFTKLNNSGMRGTLSFSQNGPFAPVIAQGQIDGLSNPLKIQFNESTARVTCPKILEADKIESVRTLDINVELELADATLYGYDTILGDSVFLANSQEDVRSASTFVGCGTVELGSIWPLEAIAVVRGPDNVKGKIRFVQEASNLPVTIIGTITGLPAGEHGFHVHEIASTDDGCKAAGGHFNPHGHSHGGPKSDLRHVGDLGNIVAAENHAAFVDFTDSKISLVGPHSIINRTIVIHAEADDLGQGGHSESSTTGNAGARIACGIIQIEDDFLRVISAKAVIDSPSVKGEVNFVQEGPQDFIHLEVLFEIMT